MKADDLDLPPELAERAAGLIADAPCPITSDPARAAGAIVVVDEVDRRIAGRLLTAGALGIVLSADLEACLPAAVAAVAAGLTVVPERARRALQRPVLTARQQEILSLLVLGLPNAAIAERLYLTESTVKTHLVTIFGKLGVSSRREAMDLILDPASDLGVGIVSVSAGGEPPPSGYRSPTIRS